MRPSTHRLRSTNAVRRASRYGKSAKVKNLSLKYIDSKYPNFRITVVVSKKVHKSAVKRNKIRRKIKEATRQNFYNKLSGGLDMVIFAYSDELLKISSQELVLDLNKLFSQAGVLKT